MLTFLLWLVARMLPAPPRPVDIMGSRPREVERSVLSMLDASRRGRGEGWLGVGGPGQVR